MREWLHLIGRFIAGVGACVTCVPLPYKKYPFTFPEKALTSDWMAMGEDMKQILDKKQVS